MKRILLLLLIHSICHANIYNGNTNAIASPRDLSLNPIEIGGLYTDALTTSIKNYTLTNVSGEDRLWTFTAASKLVLENSTLELDGTFTFTHGSIYIVGKCAINGSSDFNKFRYQGSSIFIMDGSELRIGSGVNFEYAPTSSSNRGIIFNGPSSKLILQDATLTVSNRQGLNLLKGQLRIDGNSTIDNFFTKNNVEYLERKISYTETALVLGGGVGSYQDCKLKILSGATLNVKNAGIVYKNTGSKSFNGKDGKLLISKGSSFLVNGIINTGNLNIDSNKLSSEPMLGNLIGITVLDSLQYYGVNVYYGVRRCKWHPGGKYFAIGGSGRYLPGNVAVEVYSFDGYSFSSLLFRNITSTGGDWDGISDITWSGDGSYLGTVGYTYNTSQFRILSFEESSLTDMTTTAGFADSTKGWRCTLSQDGRFVAIGSNAIAAGAEVRIFRFDGSNLTFVTEVELGNSCMALKWTPDGKYLAIGINTSTIQIYYFNGTTLTLIDEKTFASGSTISSFYWSPDGKYLAAVGNTGSTGQVEIFSFDGTSITSLGRWNYYQSGDTADICEWSPDGRYLLVSGNTAASNQIEIYKFDGTDLTSLGNWDYGYVTTDPVYGISWSPDGKYILVSGKTDSGDEVFVYSVDYDMDSSKAFEMNNGTMKLEKNTTLRNINLKMK